MQRRATTIIKSLKDLLYKQRLIKLGLSTSQYRRLRVDTVESLKIFNGIDQVESIFQQMIRVPENTYKHNSKDTVGQI